MRLREQRWSVPRWEHLVHLNGVANASYPLRTTVEGGLQCTPLERMGRPCAEGNPRRCMSTPDGMHPASSSILRSSVSGSVVGSRTSELSSACIPPQSSEPTHVDCAVFGKVAAASSSPCPNRTEPSVYKLPSQVPPEPSVHQTPSTSFSRQ